MKVKRSSYHLSYYHILFFISHLWSGIDSELLPGYRINAPPNVTVQRGLCVYIPCSFIVPETERLTRNAVGIWYKNEQFAASKRDDRHFPFNRFFLVGDVWKGDCSLYIEDLSYIDKGRYHFRVEEDDFKFSYRDIQPYVEVTELTSKPEISPLKSWIDGEEVTLRCTSPGTCVQINPQITWRGNINGRVENWIINHKNGTETHFSTITFTARKEQNNSPLSCTVQLKGRLTTVQQITMKVEYSPRIVESRCHKVENRLECTCLIQSSPEPTLKWKHNGVSYNKSNHMNDKISIFTGKNLNSVTNSTLTLQINTGESQNIQCVASNIHGELVLELFNETAQLTSKAFPSAAIFGGCFAAVLIVTGVLLIIFYRKRKLMQNEEALRQTHASVVDNIYGDLEMFSNGPHVVGEIPQQDRQPPPDDGSVHLNGQNVQYMSVNFSKLKPKVTVTETEAEEIEYSVVKRTT